MSCTICGKPHTVEAPLTIAHNNEWLCPGCLEELDDYTGKRGRVISIDDYVGESGIVFPGMADSTRKSPISGYSGIIKIGTVELPIESFEMR